MSTKNKDTYTDDSSDSSDDSDYFPSESENETKKVKVLNRPSKIGKKGTSDKTNKKRKLNPPPKSGGEPKIIRIVGTGNGEPPPPELEEIMNGFFQGIGDIMNPTSELKQKVLDSHLPKDIKDKCLDRLKHSYSEKTGELISNILKIPFGKFASIPVKSTSKQEKIEEFFEKAIKTLDDCTYGMEKPKEEIINYIAQFIATNNKSSPRVLALHGLPGTGKCLAKGTKVLMFDGTLKNVEDINVGDVIMGDDSTPRNILSLGNGKDNMYKVTDLKGESYIVNSEHILTLKYSGNNKISDIKKRNRYEVKWFDNKDMKPKYKVFTYTNKVKEDVYGEAKTFFSSIVNDNVCDISIKEYLKLDDGLKKKLKGFYTSIDFPEKELDFDPYIIGLWLVDGCKRSPGITNQDSTVLKYLFTTLPKYNCYLGYNSKYDYRINSCDRNKKRKSNYFINILRKHNLLKNKHIPLLYKCNSRENRLKLLAGLIDSDGSLDCKKTCFEISQSYEHETLLDDIQYLCRSLGFSCIKNKKKTSWTYKGVKKEGIALRLSISGDGLNEIPTLIPRKKAIERKQIKNALVSGIKVESVGYDKYYGFEIDNNKRFVLGNFIVTHNTQLIKNGFAKSLQRPMSFISMGGSRDIHSFSGHSFTYVGSKYGRIIQSLIETKVMNPIIFMDELDKISLTPEGEEIQNLLIHLTDPVQNMNFEDKYFPDITFDLSKVIFIFSYNNENLINPILKDRLHIIKVPEPTEKDKVIIGKKYIIKEISSNIGFKQEDLIFEEDVIKHIIRMYTSDPGLRGLKRSIETIMLKLNASRYLGKFQKYKCFKNILISLPFKITIDMVDELLKNENNSKEEYFKSLFI